MINMVDLHCHLLAGLDDGPRNWDDSLAMCRILAEQGVSHVAALAHQCERWNVQGDSIRVAVNELRQKIADARIQLEVHAAAEVMACPDLLTRWKMGKLVSLGDHGRHLLVEMPHGVFVDLRSTVRQFTQIGVRIILAHPELYPELLHEPGTIEELIHLGCLVQISTKSVTNPETKEDSKALRDWIRRGCVHFLGSDGHSPRKRQPLVIAAYKKIVDWTNESMAKDICFQNGLRVLKGQPVHVKTPAVERRWWSVLRLW